MAAQVTVPLQSGLAGAYLAARNAAIAGDHREAAVQFQRVLREDPDNVTVLGDALLALAAIGDWTQAATYAARVPEGTEERDFANLVNRSCGCATAISLRRGRSRPTRPAQAP